MTSQQTDERVEKPQDDAAATKSTMWRSVPERLAGSVGAAAGGVLLWMLVSLISDVPSPLAVLGASGELVTDVGSYEHIVATLRRVLVGFVGGVAIGVFLGVTMGLLPWFQALVKPWVIIFLSVPGPVIIIVAILVLGLGEFATLTALVLTVMPFVTNIMMGSVRSLDPTLTEMSKVFGAAAALRWREVVFPQLVPSFFAALQTGFSLSWKLVVVIEALSTSRGIGAAMHQAFRTLQPDRGIAWAALFTIVMVLVDVFVFRRTERWILRWRQQADWT